MLLNLTPEKCLAQVANAHQIFLLGSHKGI